MLELPSETRELNRIQNDVVKLAHELKSGSWVDRDTQTPHCVHGGLTFTVPKCECDSSAGAALL